MSLELIDSYQEKIENANQRSERTRYATELYSKLSVKELDDEAITLAASLIGNNLSEYIADRIIEDYKIWRKLVLVEEGRLDPSDIRTVLNTGIERKIFTSSEVMDAEISYNKKNGRDKQTVLVHRP